MGVAARNRVSSVCRRKQPRGPSEPRPLAPRSACCSVIRSVAVKGGFHASHRARALDQRWADLRKRVRTTRGQAYVAPRCDMSHPTPRPCARAKERTQAPSQDSLLSSRFGHVSRGTRRARRKASRGFRIENDSDTAAWQRQRRPLQITVHAHVCDSATGPRKPSTKQQSAAGI